MIGPAPSRPVREISAPKVRKGEPGSVRLQGGRQAPSRGPGPQETPGGRGSGTLDKPRLDALALFPSLLYFTSARTHTAAEDGADGQDAFLPEWAFHGDVCHTHGSDVPPRSSGSPGQPCASKTEAQRQPAVPQGAPAWPLTHGGGVWPRKGRERPAWARKEMVQVAGLRAAL